MPVATLVRADALWTSSATGAPTAVADAELAFDAAGRILHAGSRGGRAVSDASAETTVIELPGRVLMPGLVNGHTHSAMTLMRGVSDDDGFMPWLEAVQRFEAQFTHDDIEAGLELAMLEMIETGTTAFADMYFWDASLIERVRAAGMRALVAPATFTGTAVGFPAAAGWDDAQVTDLTEALAAAYAGDPQIRVAYGPHAPYTSTPAFLRDIAERAARLGIPIHTHVSESPAEIEQIAGRYGATPADHLASLGLFDAEVLAAHCVHLTPSEISLLASSGAAISHNPVSNLKLGNGVAPLPEFLEAGVRLALGTDSAASNNSLDLFEEIKTGTVLHRGVRHDAAAVLASDVLDIATRRGSEAIGFGGSAGAGVLEPGRLADFVALDVTGSAATPLELSRDPVASLTSHLGFAATGRDVTDVFVGGRRIYADREHQTLDADAVRARVRAVRRRVG